MDKSDSAIVLMVARNTEAITALAILRSIRDYYNTQLSDSLALYETRQSQINSDYAAAISNHLLLTERRLVALEVSDDDDDMDDDDD